MTESAPATQQHQADVAARVEELTSLYEQKAYLIYNVALRVTLESAPAQNAARRGFVAQAAAGAPEGLAANIARLAIEEAGAAKPTPSDDPVLAANAALNPSERAALALTVLAEAEPAAMATALGIDAAAAEQLRTRAFENLAAALELPAEEAAESYESLPWAEPPAELWQTLYPELHAVASQTVRAAAQARAAQAAKPGRLRRTARSLRVWRRVPRWAAVGLVLLTAGGVAMAARGTGGGEEAAPESESAYYGGYSDSGDDGTTGGTTAGGGSSEGGGSGYDALTPKELDKLRQQELEDLKRYSKRQADRELTPRQRRNAEKAAADLVKVARRRERQAEKREQAARRQLAREREQRVRERQQQAARDRSRPPRPAQPPPPPPPQPKDEQRNPPSDDGGSDNDGPDQTECLYDTESGTYVCPE